MKRGIVCSALVLLVMSGPGHAASEWCPAVYGNLPVIEGVTVRDGEFRLAGRRQSTDRPVSGRNRASESRIPDILDKHDLSRAALKQSVRSALLESAIASGHFDSEHREDFPEPSVEVVLEAGGVLWIGGHILHLAMYDRTDPLLPSQAFAARVDPEGGGAEAWVLYADGVNKRWAETVSHIGITPAWVFFTGWSGLRHPPITPARGLLGIHRETGELKRFDGPEDGPCGGIVTGIAVLDDVLAVSTETGLSLRDTEGDWQHFRFGWMKQRMTFPGAMEEQTSCIAHLEDVVEALPWRRHFWRDMICGTPLRGYDNRVPGCYYLAEVKDHSPGLFDVMRSNETLASRIKTCELE